ncbi:MAG: DNA primase DnaG [ANME-2 cluster archaeon]|nr:DNA primase DnaG [ANME-2 cluster archaeon]MDF1532403.1 DNA primase DnaG [ANME-2 cluster archaeon]
MQNTDTTKYIVHAKIRADGVVERPDVVGAIFGQTEGLLGNDLDLRDLQKTGRIGRIEVNIKSTAGKSNGIIDIPSSLDKAETAILAASLETIDRIGPCMANIEIIKVEDIRASKRQHIVNRAKHILTDMFDENVPESQEITDEVKQSIRVEEMTYYGKDNIPCGPNVMDSDAIIVVEGRADVLNLLRYGIKNAIAVGGTNVPPAVAELCKKKKVTAFTDGDRGGELIIKELLQVAEIDFIARAPDGKGVEELVQKEIVRSLRQKIPVEQAMERYQIGGNRQRSSSQQPVRRQERREVKPRVVKAPAPTVKPRAIERPHRNSRRDESVKTLATEFKEHMDELNGTLSGRLLDDNKKVIKEVTVKDLANSIKDVDSNVKSVVFDGVITQRLVDIASEKDIRDIIGAKIGNVTKAPANLRIASTGQL